MADSGGRGRARGRAAGRSRGRARDTAAQRPGTAESVRLTRMDFFFFSSLVAIFLVHVKHGY